jgi:ABC-type Fe3+ transport system substrate-binding protein
VEGIAMMNIHEHRAVRPGAAPRCFSILGRILFAGMMLAVPMALTGPASAQSGANFDKQWADLIAAAKKEGKVTISIGAIPDYNPVFAVFTEKFGIQVQTQGGSGSARASRILAERKADRYTVDVGFLSVAATTRRLEPAGALADFPSLLIHPEVTDTSKWYGGKHWYPDERKTQTIFGFAVRALSKWQFWYNTEKLSEQDIAGLKTPNDFLDPKWKGKMADQSWSDPGRLGDMLEVYFAPDAGPDWIRKYLTEMNVSFTSDRRLEETWLVRGRNPLKWHEGNIGDAMRELAAKGIPIKVVHLPRQQGGLELRGSECCVTVFKNAPDPNAAKLFVNWFLSREGQTLVHAIKPGRPYTSLREDIPPGNTEPEMRRIPGMQYSFRDFDPDYLAQEEKAREFILQTFKEGQQKR